MRIIVCGSRSYPLDVVLPAVLRSYAAAADVTIIHGACRGVDRHAADWAHVHGVPTEPYPPDWDSYDRAAGPIRNQRMIDEGQPDLVLAFVDKPLERSRGTSDMVRRAAAAGIPVYIIQQGAEQQSNG